MHRSGQTIVDGSFHVPQDSLSSSLLTAAPGTFSLPESQCVFTRWGVFLTQFCCGKPMFSLTVQGFFSMKTYSFLQTIGCFVNVTWFTLLSQQKFHNRPLFKSKASFNKPDIFLLRILMVVWFVLFYDISTLVGYLMPNTVYTPPQTHAYNL